MSMNARSKVDACRLEIPSFVSQNTKGLCRDLVLPAHMLISKNKCRKRNYEQRLKHTRTEHASDSSA